MPLVTKFQLGVKDESTYGTAVVVDRFFEAYSDQIKVDQRRIESKNMRAATRVQRTDRWAPWRAGANGPIEFEVLSKGFGWWLKHMLGTSATTGPVDSAYTHTGTIGDLKADSFTCQTNRPFHPADTDRPFTWEGGKIPAWELSMSVGGLLVFKPTLDFEDFTNATALASASYPTAMEPFDFTGCAITIAGSAYNFGESFKINVDNRLALDQFRLKGSGLKNEPPEVDMRAVSWEIGADWDSTTQFDRFISATKAGALATIVATFSAPTLIGATSVPQVIVTIDSARFDDLENGVNGPDPLKQRITGRGLFDGTDSAVTVAVVNADATA